MDFLRRTISSEQPQRQQLNFYRIFMLIIPLFMSPSPFYCF